MMKTYTELSNIEPEAITRASCGFQELDWMYGYSTGPIDTNWGFPCHKISLWAGAGGIGKSRMAVAVAKNLCNLGFKVLYFQTEESLGSFAAKVKEGNTKIPNNFLGSEASTLVEQIEAIRSSTPGFIFVDSINEMEDFKSGTARDIKKIFAEYRVVTKDLPCHVIFLTQLNKDGSEKGSTALTHLADVNFKLVPCGKKASSIFEIIISGKHRHGRNSSNIYSRWEHTPTGIECISDYSLQDEVWCNLHNIPVRDMKEYYDSIPIVVPKGGKTIKIFEDFPQEEEQPKHGLINDLRTLLFGK